MSNATDMGTHLHAVPDHDPVTAPRHYTRLDPQPLDVIERWGLDYHDGNVVKYLCRAGYKDKGRRLEDYRKALAYLERKVRLVEQEEGSWQHT